MLHAHQTGRWCVRSVESSVLEIDKATLAYLVCRWEAALVFSAVQDGGPTSEQCHQATNDVSHEDARGLESAHFSSLTQLKSFLAYSLPQWALGHSPVPQPATGLLVFVGGASLIRFPTASV